MPLDHETLPATEIQRLTELLDAAPAIVTALMDATPIAHRGSRLDTAKADARDWLRRLSLAQFDAASHG